MPRVFDIIKTRWSEVLLLVGFQTGVLFLSDQIMMATQRQAEGRAVAMSDGAAFLLGLGTMGFAIVWQMLYMGFLRTAYVQGCMRWEPGQLLRVGRYYFWRMVRFGFLLFVTLAGLGVVALSVAFAVTGAQAPADLPVWANIAVPLVVLIALMKPLVLSPAIMVAGDAMAFRAFSAVGEYTLMQTPAIPAIYIGTMAFTVALSTFDATLSLKGSLHYVVTAGHHIVLSLATLVLNLMALRLIKAGEPEPAAEETEEASEDAWA